MTSEGHKPLNHNPVLLTSRWTTEASRSVHARPHFSFPNWRVTCLVETCSRQWAVTSRRHNAADAGSDHSTFISPQPGLSEQEPGSFSLGRAYCWGTMAADHAPHQAHLAPYHHHPPAHRWTSSHLMIIGSKNALLGQGSIAGLDMDKFYGCFCGFTQPSPGCSSGTSNSQQKHCGLWSGFSQMIFFCLIENYLFRKRRGECRLETEQV